MARAIRKTVNILDLQLIEARGKDVLFYTPKYVFALDVSGEWEIGYLARALWKILRAKSQRLADTENDLRGR